MSGPSEPRRRGIEEISDLKNSMGDLIEFAVGGDQKRPWVRFCLPESRGRDNRPPALWWEEVVRKFKSDMPAPRRIRRRPGSNPSFSHDRMMMLAYNARFAAHLKLRDPSSEVSLKDFPHEIQKHMREELRRKRTTWDDEVEKKWDSLREKLALDDGV